MMQYVAFIAVFFLNMPPSSGAEEAEVYKLLLATDESTKVRGELK